MKLGTKPSRKSKASMFRYSRIQSCQVHMYSIVFLCVLFIFNTSILKLWNNSEL